MQTNYNLTSLPPTKTAYRAVNPQHINKYLTKQGETDSGGGVAVGRLFLIYQSMHGSSFPPETMLTKTLLLRTQRTFSSSLPFRVGYYVMAGCCCWWGMIGMRVEDMWLIDFYIQVRYRWPGGDDAIPYYTSALPCLCQFRKLQWLNEIL